MRESLIERILALTDEQLELLISLFEDEEQAQQEHHRTSA